MSASSIRATDFESGIGVATHIPYTDGGYANLTNVRSDLAYLGVTKLRDGISNGENGSASLASYIQLTRAGQKFTFVVGGGASTTASLQYTLNTIAQLVAAVPGSVTAIEGPNEINNQTLTFNGVGGLQGAVALQQSLYRTVKGTPALTGVSVDYFTGYGTVGFAAGPDPSTASGLAHLDNQHPNPQGGQGPATFLDPSTALPNEPGAKGSFVYTETGYTTNRADVNGVDATVQGKYTLDLLMDAAKDGSSGTYLYQLMDAYKPGSPQGDDGYGLFDENNNPKLAATGIHNLAAILADTGATASTFTPTPLNYSLSGLPSTGNSLEMSKSDGTTDIAVWAEPQLWNAATKSEVAPSSQIATLNLGAAHQVSVYDPLAGTMPVATYASTSSIQLQVTDHPLIVQVGAAVTGPAISTGSATLGNGLDKLVLAISEDAYKGDAQYTVSVDGVQVGGVLTAAASHAAGAADTVTIYGDWGVGSHTVGVNFLNDAYAGTAATDRNLYVNGAVYDGAAVANSAEALLSGGTQQFTFKDVTPASAGGQNQSIGNGSDQLVLAIGEDAYGGNAQFTVSVDGKQVGGTVTAHAAQASGKSDLLDVYGDWGGGQHSVVVNFLNDAYGGTSAADRNLYVNGLTYDGAVNSTKTTALLSSGPQQFTFHR